MADYRQYAQPWQDKMRSALCRVAVQPQLSTDVDDKLKRILGADYPAKATPAPARTAAPPQP
jgi:hypothetical protein